MRKIFIIILLISFTNIYSQKKKLYFDNYNNEISFKRFEELKEKNIEIQWAENDTILIQKIFYKQKVVKLDSIQLKQVQQFLSKIIGEDYTYEKRTVIHLFDSPNNVFKKSINYKKYWNYIRRNRKKLQSFIIGTKNSGIQKNKNFYVFLDQYDMLRKLFIPDSMFEINHIFIEPNGINKIFYGYDDILTMLDFSI